MKYFFISCCLSVCCFTASSQTVFTTGPSSCTPGGLLCVGSTCTAANSASDEDLSTFATVNVVIGVACTNTLTSDFASLQPAGRWTGFFIAGVDLLTLISSITLRITNTNTSQTQAFSSSSILTLLASGRGLIQVQSPFDFNHIEITLAGIVGAVQSVDVYYGFSSNILRDIDLPVTWISFSGIESNDKVILNWVTADESNSSHFNVERSGTSSDFQLIGRVEASGNNSGNASYSFVDQSPLKGKDNFYRVSQVDFDNKFSYSSTIMIRVSAGNGFTAYVAYDPGRNFVKLTIEGISNTERLLFEILDAEGKLVHNEQALVTGPVFTKNISRKILVKGIYYYKITRLSGGPSLRGRFFLD